MSTDDRIAEQISHLLTDDDIEHPYVAALVKTGMPPNPRTWDGSEWGALPGPAPADLEAWDYSLRAGKLHPDDVPMFRRRLDYAAYRLVAVLIAYYNDAANADLLRALADYAEFCRREVAEENVR